jgi:hypothetical protein
MKYLNKKKATKFLNFSVSSFELILFVKSAFNFVQPTSSSLQTESRKFTPSKENSEKHSFV